MQEKQLCKICGEREADHPRRKGWCKACVAASLQRARVARALEALPEGAVCRFGIRWVWCSRDKGGRFKVLAACSQCKHYEECEDREGAEMKALLEEETGQKRKQGPKRVRRGLLI